MSTTSEPMLSSLVSELSKGLTQTTELLEKNDARALSKWLDSTTDASKLPMTKLVRFGVSQALSPGSSPLMKANRDLSVALSPHQSDLNRLNGLLNVSPIMNSELLRSKVVGLG